MSAWRSRCVVIFLLLSLCVIDAASETENDGTKDLLRLHVPFPLVQRQGLDLEHRKDDSRALYVKRVLAAQAPPTCTQPPTKPNDKSTQSNSMSCADNIMAADAGDRLVAVDGLPISLKSFQEVIDGPIGSSVIVPLFKSSTKGQENVLSGFARIEILRPNSIEFEPTTDERMAIVRQWQQDVARRKQEELEREQDERERKAAEENAKLELEAQQKRDKEEQERLRMTPHDQVRNKRNVGKEFRYEVVFETRGPIGLNWDLHETTKTIVSYLEPKMPAQKLNVIEPKDQLIQLNDVNTTDMGPYQVVEAYLNADLPRRMVFLCAAKAPPKDPTKADGLQQPQNWTLTFTAPSILSGWQVRLHIPPWSPLPTINETNAVQLLLAHPFTACATPVEKEPKPVRPYGYLTYRGGCSFVDKAESIGRTKAELLLVINNVKGEGRFPSKMPALDSFHINVPVGMVSKVDGELTTAVIEHSHAATVIEQEDPSQVPTGKPPAPRMLTNEELVVARNPAKAAQNLTFWFLNASVPQTMTFAVLPALFGSVISVMPYRIVAAYPQETACHPKGLGILATRAVVLVKRGGCSFATKLRSVQLVGGAGMLMINSDATLLPLMSDKKEAEGLTIWGATINAANGTAIEEILVQNKNIPSLVKIMPREPDKAP